MAQGGREVSVVCFVKRQAEFLISKQKVFRQHIIDAAAAAAVVVVVVVTDGTVVVIRVCVRIGCLAAAVVVVVMVVVVGMADVRGDDYREVFHTHNNIR